MNDSAPERVHPYTGLPEYTFWHKAMGAVPPFAVDPLVDVPFRIDRTSRVATGGSCFAQHISRAIEKNGGNYYVVEDAPPSLSPELHSAWNYRTYSARYANLYTARQLLQLFDRAYGRFVPELTHWRENNNSYIDPFRPGIQPSGFTSLDDLIADRERHLSAVRHLFETLDVFIFTLGLTESWECLPDGAALPLAPGVAGGEWDRNNYRFHNYSVAEVESDLLAFIDRLREVNPRSRLILTVSPVPLAATYEKRHVLVSTCFSKAVLRVAANTCCTARPDVTYFPAYELITGPHAGSGYYDDDLRSVTPAGVDHVMRTFFRHYVGDAESIDSARADISYASGELAALQDIVCDEETLAK